MFGIVRLIAPICLLFLAATTPLKAQDPHTLLRPGILEVVRAALRSNRQLQSQSWQVEINRGTLEQASGQFDAALTSNFNRSQQEQNSDIAPSALFETDTQALNYNLGLVVPFRNGITVSPGVSVNQSRDNAFNQVPFGTGSASVTVTVPLLRGLGEAATGASEQASKIALSGAQLLYSQEVAQTASLAAGAYWNWLAAKAQLVVAHEAEDRAQRLLDASQALVKADVLPAAELDNVRASLAADRGARLLAEQAFFAAKQSLGLVMGLTGPEISRLEPAPESFPTAPDQATLPSEAAATYGTMALKLRGDYASALANVQAQAVLLRAARLNEKPLLNVGFQAGYTGYEPNRFYDLYGPLARNYAGPTYGLSFNVAWPFANRVARGLTIQQRAQYEQSRLQADDLAATIDANVEGTVETFQVSIEALQQAQIASRLYIGSVEKERQRFKGGEATVVDQLTVEGFATQAETNLIQAQLLYATSLVQLRLETGTLVEVRGGSFSLSPDGLTTPPPLP
jgi:outer membrane protein